MIVPFRLVFTEAGIKTIRLFASRTAVTSLYLSAKVGSGVDVVVGLTDVLSVNTTRVPGGGELVRLPSPIIVPAGNRLRLRATGADEIAGFLDTSNLPVITSVPVVPPDVLLAASDQQPVFAPDATYVFVR